MFGKVTNALIRREADAYRAQGLQEEALRLFRNILDSREKIPPDVRRGIEQQILEIEAEIAAIDVEERQQVSEEQIAVIKQGWSENAALDDLIVAARELHALGRYGDALQEFSRSIQRGYSPHRVIAPVADCLIHLNAPQEIPGSVRVLAREMFQDPKETYSFMLALAEQMLKEGHRKHAAALGWGLAEFDRAPASYRSRLEALIKGLKSFPTQNKPAPAQDGPAFRGLGVWRFIRRWIREAGRR
jgi:tetratricopeptide (TPR) repeat protein